jgi:hypothetical protein
MKIRPLGDKLFDADGETVWKTDITKLIFTSVIFQKRLKQR